MLEVGTFAVAALEQHHTVFYDLKFILELGLSLALVEDDHLQPEIA